MTHPRKTYLQHYAKGVLFAGAMILPGRKYLSRRTVTNCWRALDDFNRGAAQGEGYCLRHAQDFVEVMNSYFGLMGHFNEWRLIHRIICSVDSQWFTVMTIVGCCRSYHVEYRTLDTEPLLLAA